MTTQTIRFFQHGAIREVHDVPATRTVLQHLRAQLVLISLPVHDVHDGTALQLLGAVLYASPPPL